MHRDARARNAVSVWLRSIWHTLLDTIFPAKCLVCRRFFQSASANPAIDPVTRTVADIRDLLPQAHRWLRALCCQECVKALTAISEPLCPCCGMIFKEPHNDNHLCGDCILQPKKFHMARAAMVYDQQSMAIIHRFKYAGKTQLAKPFGVLLLNTYLRYWQPEAIDLILPVPLHNQKFRHRGFNQSYLMVDCWKTIPALNPFRASQPRLRTDVLSRSKATASQTGLGRQQRLKNIKGAISVRMPDTVYARKILVVDDVYTTGATVNECARALLAAGAAQVDVLTLARAV
ncbi:MAG: ComF family protein [Deltaproteobacteria bacterium]|nr:ComF family protein [Deltaproteobacteria bacterium]MBW2515846.1 ComF family protein [Deltaproteobacteria bacterium]